jgi:hypothetical protein
MRLSLVFVEFGSLSAMLRCGVRVDIDLLGDKVLQKKAGFKSKSYKLTEALGDVRLDLESGHWRRWLAPAAP